MSSLTDIREALAAALAAIDAELEVVPAGGKYEEEGERFVVRLVVGEKSPETEARLDLLLGKGPESLKATLQLDPTLAGTVSAQALVSHAGWRLFPQPDGPPLLGSELTVQTYL